jgi:hypothetical protein
MLIMIPHPFSSRLRVDLATPDSFAANKHLMMDTYFNTGFETRITAWGEIKHFHRTMSDIFKVLKKNSIVASSVMSPK